MGDTLIGLHVGDVSKQEGAHNPEGRRERELWRRAGKERGLPGQGESLGQRASRAAVSGKGPLIIGQQLSGETSQNMESRQALNGETLLVWAIF